MQLALKRASRIPTHYFEQAKSPTKSMAFLVYEPRVMSKPEPGVETLLGKLDA
jgi:hypothetical protein